MRDRKWNFDAHVEATTESGNEASDVPFGGNAHLYIDDSAALAFWKDRLSAYVDLQGQLDALRLRPSSEPPWPGSDNPMLAYLEERTAEIASNEGMEAATRWLAANAWFEGAIAERSRFVRLLDAD